MLGRNHSGILGSMALSWERLSVRCEFPSASERALAPEASEGGPFSRPVGALTIVVSGVFEDRGPGVVLSDPMNGTTGGVAPPLGAGVNENGLSRVGA